MESVYYTLTASDVGNVGIVWKRESGTPTIVKISFHVESMGMDERIRHSFPNARRDSHNDIETISEKILKYMAGNIVEFSLSILDMGICSEFQKGVLNQTWMIPRGKVSTYGWLAGKLGMPKAARAVGTALATNPFPLVIPCHRVIRSDGSLGGYGGGLKMKKALLSMEGIEFESKDKVFSKCFWGYKKCVSG
ncbi:MAG: methylated-DNA--[protein]-cysteine S-methyltransferase [Syntrophaceae bacterium]